MKKTTCKAGNITSAKLVALFLSVLSCGATKADTFIQSIPLNGEWSLTYWEQPAEPVDSPAQIKNVDAKTIKSIVPGNVEIDLQRAGLISDPMVGSNVYELRKWEGYQWCYTKTFGAPAIGKGQRLQLFFGGIDCLAKVWLNGKLIGSPENMLIEHTYDITKDVKPNGNTLQVILRSPVIEGQNKFLGTFSIGNFPSEESQYLRKAPHMFGWDIMPRLVSAGLWRSVELRVLDETRFRDVNYYVKGLDAANRRANLYVDVQLTMPFNQFGHATARVTLSRHGKTAFTASQIIESPAMRIWMPLKGVDLWWPRGYGEPALYDAKTEIVDADGKVLASDSRRIGVRSVQLDRSDINLPEKPGKFRFIVNGEPVYVRGVNWTPLDALHSRDASLVDSAMAMVVDLNCNMIRCWGGNVYEDSRLFDLCDENGIMVWQDFSMGCAFYPQRDDFANAIEQEVISVVKKLRSHPSLVLWAGNNEDDSALRYWGFDPNDDRISRGVIPHVLYEFDNQRPYLPSSPYISEEVYKRGGDENLLPENHLWGPRGYYKADYYDKAKCQFVSEIGYHGCPNAESLRKMFTKDCVYPWVKNFEWNEEWLTKSVRRFPSMGKTFDRNNLMINQVHLVFGDVPRKLDDFIFASQSVQAEAMKHFVEMWRAAKFSDKTGMIWWNLKDGWPLISDAIVDYYFSKKMAYQYLRTAQRTVSVFCADGAEGSCRLMAVADTCVAVSGSVTVSDVATGKKLYEGKYDVPRNGKTEVARIQCPAGQGMLLISYNVSDGKESYSNHYLYGKPPYKLSDYKEWLSKLGIYNVKEQR